MEHLSGKGRELPIDIARGLGIILVVAGHSVASWRSPCTLLHNFIYSFHIPLFFTMSCIFISKNKSIASFIKSKAERFLLPYLFWVGFYFFFVLFHQTAKLLLINMVTLESLPQFISIKKMSYILFHANYSALHLHSLFLHLWFLPTVFVLVIMQRAIDTLVNDKIKYLLPLVLLLTSYSIVTINNYYDFHSKVPWGIDIAIVILPFIYIAKLREHFYKLNPLLILILFLLILYFAENINVGDMKINNYVSFCLTSSAGIIMVLMVSAKLQFYKIGNYLVQIGNSSYVIYVLHVAVFAAWHPIVKQILNIKNEEIINLSYFILGIIVPILIFPIFRKFNILRYLAFGDKSTQKIA